jgi:hypothetical protein
MPIPHLMKDGMMRIHFLARSVEIVSRGHSNPFPVLRTFMSRLYRMWRLIYLKYALALVSLAIPIYGFTQNLVVNIVSSILGIAGIFLTFKVWYGTMHGYYPWPLMPINTRKVQIPAPMQASGYALIRRKGVPGDALLTSERINHALLNGDNSELSVDGTVFKAKHLEQVDQILLHEFTSKKDTVLFNGKKVRLVVEPLLNNEGLLAATHIQPTHYFDTLKTNDALNISIRYGANQSKVFDGHEFCFPDNVVRECSVSDCANQIGMSTIAFTSDGYLVIVGQSEPNAFSKKLWAPSGSGSADWKDVRTFKDLQQFVKFAARRELTEECGWSVSDVAWIRTFGYGRLLHRGGLPQFFCLARLNCPYSKVKRTRPEKPFVSFHRKMCFERENSYRDAVQALRQELWNNNHFLSSVLWYCFELLWRLPDHDLDEVFSQP